MCLNSPCDPGGMKQYCFLNSDTTTQIIIILYKIPVLLYWDWPKYLTEIENALKFFNSIKSVFIWH